MVDEGPPRVRRSRIARPALRWGRRRRDTADSRWMRRALQMPSAGRPYRLIPASRGIVSSDGVVVARSRTIAPGTARGDSRAGRSGEAARGATVYFTLEHVRTSFRPVRARGSSPPLIRVVAAWKTVPVIGRGFASLRHAADVAVGVERDAEPIKPALSTALREGRPSCSSRREQHDGRSPRLLQRTR